MARIGPVGPFRAQMRLLYFIRDPYPCTRRDVLTLFGERLHALGIGSDIVATLQRETDHGDPARGGPSHDGTYWPAGAEHLHVPSQRPGLKTLGTLLHDLRMLWRASGYDALVVRDKIVVAALAIVICGASRVFYWMSFPMPEADLARARSHAERRFRRVALWLRGQATGVLLYRFVVPRAARVFVQSRRMGEVVAARSGRNGGLVAVPMGIDEVELAAGGAVPNARVAGDPFRIVYLGSMDRLRRIDFLLDVLREVMRRDPQRGYRLVLIGGASTPDEYDWLVQRVKESGLSGFVEMPGPLARDEAWRLAGGCHLGISAIPRGEVFDVSSPTKMLEYLALGLPVLVNDIPDQAQILDCTAGAGLCRPMQADRFAEAVLQIRADYADFAAAAAASRPWLQASRGYEVLAGRVAATLREALPDGR